MNKQSNVIGITGWSGCGKTTLICNLIPHLRARGLSVATCKHAHHSFDTDHPEKDSYKIRKAGAEQVIVSSAKRWAKIHELQKDEKEWTLEQLLNQLEPCDIVLVEGYKKSNLPKLEVHRHTLGKPLLASSDPLVFAIACDDPPPKASQPVLPLNQPHAIAEHILTRLSAQAPL
ncbi:MAG: molybdopterin-guanine dinucleotide biosynthesis protein B [Alphaproteobacteria bacterium]